MPSVDETDGRPVSTYRPGDELPGGVRAGYRLGVGHRCETWLGWSEELWQPVVVKFARPDQLTHPRARRSLARETAALAGNLHPALPRLYADGTEEPMPHVVLEHIDGPDLDDEIDANGALTDLETATLGVQLLAAARAVHRRGLVHVDIKPANVLLRNGRPVLLDFGSARQLGAHQPAGELIGSPGYAAPELEAGDPIAAAMDVFGVGVTLWEARTGRIAFDEQLAAADRPLLEPSADTPVGAVVARMTAIDPGGRPSLDDLLAFLSDAAGDVARPAWARRPLSAAS